MKKMEIDGRTVYVAGAEKAKICVIEPIGIQDEETLDIQWQAMLSGKTDSLCYAALKIEDWNTELTPWKTPAVFGKQSFGDGAGCTLDYMLQKMIPALKQIFQLADAGVTYILGGYSLGGLFSLWAGYQTDFFRKIAAISPSVWYPQWDTYMQEKKMLADKVYMSLGDKEDRTKNKTMACVRERMEMQYQQLLKQLGEDCCILEWNQGNHFHEPVQRKVKGFSALL